ncbi:MAG: ABC transporter ATP-binding protein [Candidatus Hodarchaeales archaeon]|jgi:putative ABC transport system ATP-binding protein
MISEEITKPFVELQGVNKVFKLGEVEIQALRSFSLIIAKGEFIAVVGPSGCGKTTLLNLIGGIDRPSAGKITVDDQLLSSASKGDLNTYRRENVAFIFQFFNLLPTLTAKENVLLAASLYHRSRKEAFRETEKWLDLVGLKDKLNKFPHQLSGGEQQRVAIARSLSKHPKLLLADEPTGNLDSKSAKNIMRLLKKLNDNEGVSIVIVTHNPSIANVADRIIYLKDGSVFGEAKPSPRDAEQFWAE